MLIIQLPIITGRVNGPRFPKISRQLISSLGNNEAREITGLSVNQLQRLCNHSPIPDSIIYRNRYQFSGEETFLHYMVFNCLGDTKLKLSQNYFGGDPRRFTYSIRLVGIHFYEMFYHKVSGDSMRMWMDKFEEFRYDIWDKLQNGATLEYIIMQSLIMKKYIYSWELFLNHFVFLFFRHLE